MNDFRIKHHFSSGVYIREQKLDAGGVVQTHRHTFDHFGILGKGSASVEVDGVGRTYEGPAVIEIKANKSHRIEALTDIIWLCVHATEETDPMKIDHAVIGKAA